MGKAEKLMLKNFVACQRTFTIKSAMPPIKSFFRSEAHKDSLQNTSNALHTLFTAEVGNSIQGPDKWLMPVQGLEFLKGHELTPENHEFLDRHVAHIKEPPSDEPTTKEKARLALKHLFRKERKSKRS